MSRALNIAMIGTGFMGRAHSNAWMSVGKFFDLPREPIQAIVCGLDARETKAFARKWGWSTAVDDPKAAVKAPAVSFVDVCTPNHLHAAHSIAALEAGKHVACEKPLAGTLDDARAMRDAARKARRRGVHAWVWFNYRRCPALALAHQMIRRGRLGRIMHVRAAYLQDWGGPATPQSWRFDSKLAGSGAHGDLNAHLVDLARFLTGDEVVEVSGAVAETFVKARKAASGPRKSKARSTVDDCTLFLARFAGGAVASFEATRVATGNLNRNTIEINGERGSVKFDFERMNELLWWDQTLEPALRGWSRILCTTPGAHPYMEAYWPPGHSIGYEHQFISQAADMVRVIAGRKSVVPLADFEDAYQTQRVLHAALLAARERCAVSLSEVR